MEKWIADYLQGLSPAEFNFQISLLFLALGFLLFKTYQAHRRYRFVSDTATSRIASAAQGYVELKGLGELMPGDQILSPFSQRRCLWYQCIVERKKRHGKNTVWVEESNEISDHLFHLQDETGVCVVMPEGAHIVPSENHVWYGNHLAARQQAKHRAGRFSRYMGYGRYRFTEKLITIADALYVIGWFQTHQNIPSTRSISSQVESLLAKWKQQPAKYLKPFDLDGNAKIQQQEWKLIRSRAEQEVRKHYPTSVHHTISKPQQINHPFIISTQPEQQLLKRKRGLMLLYLVIFFLLLYVFLTAIKLH